MNYLSGKIKNEQKEIFNSKRRTISRYHGIHYYQYNNAYIYKDDFYNNSNLVIESRIIINNGLFPGERYSQLKFFMAYLW